MSISSGSEPLTVAYQGVAGAYGEEAALLTRPGGEPRGYPTFPDVFAAVASGEAGLGVVPVENSLAGAVHQNFDLLLEHDLPIVGEVVVRVRHHLLAPPGVGLHEVRRVYSHPQALAQAHGFLRRHGLAPVPTYDTAGAAEELARSGERGAAAIASRRAGELYGLTTLAAGIEDEPWNYTRFLVLAREPAPVAPRVPAKTSLVLVTRHEEGALLRCLEVLARNEHSMTKLESRPRPGRPFEYLFFLDFEGNVAEPRTQQVLDELRAAALSVKVLGSYPAKVAHPPG